MARKSGLDIKKRILEVLKRGECSLRGLETKVNTNYQSIRKHVEELEYFGKVEVIKHKRSEKTGRPYTSVMLK